MANPLVNENKIYEQIKAEKLKVPQVVWELINHHVRNDLYSVSVALGALQMTPKWILKTASFVIKFLYKASFQPGPPPESLITVCDAGLNRIKEVDGFLKGLRDKTS